MREIWLRSNRRLLVLIGLLGLAGMPLGLWLLASAQSTLVTVLAVALLIAVAVKLLFIAALWRLPRLAYDGRSLLAYLDGARPIRVPIEIVECFLLGQGPALLPGEKHAQTETTTLVVKLSNRAEEWSHVTVDPRLASWCDGYITIRGTWTEPLNLPVVQRLNERLHAVARATAERAAR